MDEEERAGLVGELNENPAGLGKVYQRVLDAVPFDEAADPEGGENIFFYPTANAIIMLFIFPDEYIGVTTASEVVTFIEHAGGSQIMDHIIRSMSGE
ncbi:hypothetical protein KTS45_11195 [Halomicroarcula limicola]|uniref:Uncharacterized protein n=1 Tax=Haloarcula limicola TaxID=1429915 RepID=A0A8J8C516_9EURY|nr:hypothetical protein [Halomicroarcula limicola]MBV0924764.1 hypothetical protein [Halomicroarcula limicola]